MRIQTYIVGAVFIGAIIFTVCNGPAWACQAGWGPDFKTRYDWIGGCKVEHNGKFWPEAKLRATDL